MPILTKSLGAASNDLLRGRLARKKDSSKHAYQGGIWHGKRRRNTPTRLTLREHLCASAQPSSRDEIPAIHDSLG